MVPHVTRQVRRYPACFGAGRGSVGQCRGQQNPDGSRGDSFHRRREAAEHETADDGPTFGESRVWAHARPRAFPAGGNMPSSRPIEAWRELWIGHSQSDVPQQPT